MLLIGVTVVTQGLRTKPSGAEIGVALGVVVSSYVKIGVGFGGWRWVQMRSEIRRLRDAYGVSVGLSSGYEFLVVAAAFAVCAGDLGQSGGVDGPV